MAPRADIQALAQKPNLQSSTYLHLWRKKLGVKIYYRDLHLRRTYLPKLSPREIFDYRPLKFNPSNLQLKRLNRTNDTRPYVPLLRVLFE